VKTGVYNVGWYRVKCVVKYRQGRAAAVWRMCTVKESFVSSLTCRLLVQTCSGVRHLTIKEQGFFLLRVFKRFAFVHVA
jgi:hypothetical protein